MRNNLPSVQSSLCLAGPSKSNASERATSLRTSTLRICRCAPRFCIGRLPRLVASFDPGFTQPRRRHRAAGVAGVCAGRVRQVGAGQPVVRTHRTTECVAVARPDHRPSALVLDPPHRRRPPSVPRRTRGDLTDGIGRPDAGRRGLDGRAVQRTRRTRRTDRRSSSTTTTASIEPRVHRFVADLLRHPPLAVHLVIVSREEPPLPIGTLRAQGRLNELRGADLAFSADEFSRFMKQELPRPLTPQQIDRLSCLDRRMARRRPTGRRGDETQRQRRRGGRRVPRPSSPGVSHRRPGRPRAARGPPTPLRRLALRPLLCCRLCDAAASNRPTIRSEPTMTGAEFIDWLRQHNLFVVQLDPTGDWYRFHHLFARLLANWRASNPQRRILRGDDPPGRSRRVLRARDARRRYRTAASRRRPRRDRQARRRARPTTHRGGTVGRTRTPRVTHPRRRPEQRSRPAAAQACVVGENESRYVQLNAILDRVEHLLEPTPTSDRRSDGCEVRSPCYAACTRSSSASDFEGAIADARTARRLLEDHPGRRLTLAYILEVTALAGAGRSEEAHRLADTLVGDPRFAVRSSIRCRRRGLFLGWLEGDLESEERYAAQLLSTAEHERRRTSTPLAHLLPGDVCL